MSDLLIGRTPGVVRLRGDLDVARVPELWATFDAVPRIAELVVDLVDVGVLSAATLGALVHEAKRRPAGLRLRNPSALHCRILDSTGLGWLVDGTQR